MNSGRHGKRDTAVAAVAATAVLTLAALGRLNDLTSTATAYGWAVTMAVAGAVMALLWFWRERRSALRGGRRLVSAGLVLCVIAGVVWAASGTGRRSDPTGAVPSTPGAQPAASTGPSVQPLAAPTQSPIPPTVAVALGALDSCGPAEQPVVLPRLEICVVDWCKGDVFNDNGVVADRRQLKIKPRILNNGSQPINITITRPSALRLLVPLTKGPYPWKPPPRTSRAGDRVVAVSWNGHRYWAVPPNVPGDARMTPSGFYTGFATAWDGTSLPAESVYYRAVTYRNGRAVRRGDLVFELPTNSKGLIEFSALALIAPATGQVRAAHAADRWPRASDPDSF